MGENNGKNEKRENNAKSLVNTRKNELRLTRFNSGQKNPPWEAHYYINHIASDKKKVLRNFERFKFVNELIERV